MMGNGSALTNSKESLEYNEDIQSALDQQNINVNVNVNVKVSKKKYIYNTVVHHHHHHYPNAAGESNK